MGMVMGVVVVSPVSPVMLFGTAHNLGKRFLIAGVTSFIGCVDFLFLGGRLEGRLDEGLAADVLGSQGFFHPACLSNGPRREADRRRIGFPRRYLRPCSSYRSRFATLAASSSSSSDP